MGTAAGTTRTIYIDKRYFTGRKVVVVLGCVERK